ncbi:MAG: hypothetical protein CEO40_133, partial [Parcubacteria group bacterium LiPW_72]
MSRGAIILIFALFYVFEKIRYRDDIRHGFLLDC